MCKYLTADPLSCHFSILHFYSDMLFIFKNGMFNSKIIYAYINYYDIYHHFFKESQYLLFWGDFWWKLLKWICGGWWRDGPVTGTVFKVRYGGAVLLTTRNANTGKPVQLHRGETKIYGGWVNNKDIRGMTDEMISI